MLQNHFLFKIIKHISGPDGGFKNSPINPTDTTKSSHNWMQLLELFMQ